MQKLHSDRSVNANGHVSLLITAALALADSTGWMFATSNLLPLNTLQICSDLEEKKTKLCCQLEGSSFERHGSPQKNFQRKGASKGV